MLASPLFYNTPIQSRGWRRTSWLIRGFCFLSALLVCAHPVTAQLKVKFVVHDKSEIKRDTILITGSFNNWEASRNPKYFLSGKTTSEKSIELSLPAGLHEYKYSGGTWLSAEKNIDGTEFPNRLVRINKTSTPPFRGQGVRGIREPGGNNLHLRQRPRHTTSHPRQDFPTLLYHQTHRSGHWSWFIIEL